MPEKRTPSPDARKGARLPGNKKSLKSEPEFSAKHTKPEENKTQPDIDRGVTRIRGVFGELDFDEHHEAQDRKTGKAVLSVKSLSGKDVSVIIEYSVVSENLFKIKIFLQNAGFNFRPEEQEVKINGVREKLQQAELMASCGTYFQLCFDWARVREDFRDKISELEQKYGLSMNPNVK